MTAGVDDRVKAPPLGLLNLWWQTRRIYNEIGSLLECGSPHISRRHELQSLDASLMMVRLSQLLRSTCVKGTTIWSLYRVVIKSPARYVLPLMVSRCPERSGVSFVLFVNPINRALGEKESNFISILWSLRDCCGKYL